MKRPNLRFALVAIVVAAAGGGVALVTSACGGSSSSASDEDAGKDGSSTILPTGTPDGSVPGDAGVPQDATTTPDGSPGDAGGGATFTYHPSWSGVTSASVWGQFGTPTDWTAPFLTLTSDGQGGFTGSAALSPGTYAYVLQTTGDADGPDGGADLKRFVVDPLNSAIIACPAASPTYTAGDVNPCSELTVPSAGPSVVHHVTGTVTNGGAPASGWLVQIERNDTGYHHFFADRTTVGSDGTFDLVVAAGGYQLFLENPDFLSVTDAAQHPEKVATYRREVSTGFTVAGDLATQPPSVGYSSYASMTPRGDAGVLPTTFDFAIPPLGTHLALYNGKPDTIGDPWYVSDVVTDGGSAVFDGGFNTKQAGDAGFTTGARYFWGVEDELGLDGTTRGGPDAGVQWTGQTLVFAVSWQ